MARGTSIGDLAYYGAIGGGGWIAYNLALDGELGCQAYQAMAQIYLAIKKVSPKAPRPDTPAGKDPKCTTGLPGSPPSEAKPKYQCHDDHLCWLDYFDSSGNFLPNLSQKADASKCGGCGGGASPPAAPAAPAAPIPTAPSNQQRGVSLWDLGGFPLVFDYSVDSLRQDPSQGGTNIYGPGDSFNDANGSQWTWTGRADILTGLDGSTRTVDSFFT